MEQRVRIQDIAEELGLSTATVSNVIHGKTKKVSEETVRRVQEVLEQRQYIPSMAGILLAQNSSKIIGVFINDHEKYEGHPLEDAFIAASLNALSSEIEERGFFMMVKKAKKAEEILKFASMWNMDGLVIIGFCHQDYKYLRSHMHIPFVIYDGVCENPQKIVNITIDNFDGGRQMGEHMRQLGHTRALCISDNDTGVDAQRIKGFAAGFGSCPEILIVPVHKQERQSCYQQKLPLFSSVTAVFAVSDQYAAELIRFLQKNHFLIPDEISVGGFDDNSLCELTMPALTTVKQDPALRAKAAMEQLLALKNGDVQETTLMLPVTLTIRESTRMVTAKCTKK